MERDPRLKNPLEGIHPRSLTASLPLKNDGWKMLEDFPCFWDSGIFSGSFAFKLPGVTRILLAFSRSFQEDDFLKSMHPLVSTLRDCNDERILTRKNGPKNGFLRAFCEEMITYEVCPEFFLLYLYIW